jgi:putative DNA primase/helicase
MSRSFVPQHFANSDFRDLLKPADGHDVGGAVTLLDLESIKMESTEWLWDGWLARRKFHLLGGAPEAGKTTIGLALAAAISSGAYWPDGTRAPKQYVLIWSSEDGVEDTIAPRLAQMGADLTYIKVVHQQRAADGKVRPFNPATDMDLLQTAAASLPGPVGILMLDPVVSVVGAKTNSHNNAETRNALQPVIDFAKATGAAVLGITHFTKGTAGRDPTERITGSLAFGAVARIVLIAAVNHSDSPDAAPRLLTRAKSNIGKSGGGFGYDIIASPLVERPDIVATRIAWLGALEGTARELLDTAEAGAEQKERDTKIAHAQRFIKDALSGGERLQKEIEAEAEAEGISKATLKRAATKELVAKRKNGIDGPWAWRLN